jgi:hypothetical protein
VGHRRRSHTVLSGCRGIRSAPPAA